MKLRGTEAPAWACLLLLGLAGPLWAAETTDAAKASSADGYSAWWALIVIAVSGAFGGFVDGMRATRSYRVRFGAWSEDWGSVADALVGMAASVAIFAFAESIFGGGRELKDSVSAWFLIKIAAWGVLSGYAGTKLLDDLSSKAIQKLIREETGKQVSQQIAVDQQAQQIVQEAEQMRTQHLARMAVISSGAADAEAEKLLNRAIQKLRGVLGKDPQHRQAQNALANALADLGAYYKGRIAADLQGKAAAPLAEAIQIQDAIIRQDPAFSKAHYNRACYRAVAAAGDQAREQEREQAIEDLRQAIQRDEQWREYARTDPDLFSLRETAYWKSEIEGKAGATATN